MQRLEVSCAVRRLYRSLGVKGLENFKKLYNLLKIILWSNVCRYFVEPKHVTLNDKYWNVVSDCNTLYSA